MSIEPRTERILVKPHNTSTTTNTILTIKENIDIINLGVNVKNVASKSNGNVIIDVENQADKIKLTSEIHNKLGNTFEVKNINQRYPMVKIVGLEENALQINQQKLINDLVLQNEWSNLKDNSTQCLIKMIKKYKTKNGFSTVIIEVNPLIHNAILCSGKVKYGWNSYKAYDHVNVLRCFNCWGFDRIANSCEIAEEMC